MEDTDLFSLQKSTFEGAEIDVPAQLRAIPEGEYGVRALTSTKFHC